MPQTTFTSRRLQRRFMLMEVVGAAVILGIVLSCCFSMFRMIRKMQVEFGHRSQALIVLDNTVERVSAEAPCDSELLRRILDDELRQSVLSTVSGIRTVFATTDEHVDIRIVDQRGRLLGEIKLARQEAPQ